MKALDLIVVERADEQQRNARFGDERYTANLHWMRCRAKGCNTQVSAAHSKTLLCRRHARTEYARREREKRKAVK